MKKAPIGVTTFAVAGIVVRAAHSPAPITAWDTGDSQVPSIAILPA
jgi:hypothetical protein